MRTQKGITLVALVITIIVMLILAGVSISMVAGENGVLTRAEDAVESNQQAEEIEKIKLGYQAYQIAKHEEGNTDTLTTCIEAEIGTGSVAAGSSTGTLKVTVPNGGVYEINETTGVVTPVE